MEGRSFKAGLVGGLALGLGVVGFLVFPLFAFGTFGSFTAAHIPYQTNSTFGGNSGSNVSYDRAALYLYGVYGPPHAASIQSIGHQPPLLNMVILLAALAGALIAGTFYLVSVRRKSPSAS